MRECTQNYKHTHAEDHKGNRDTHLKNTHQYVLQEAWDKLRELELNDKDNSTAVNLLFQLKWAANLKTEALYLFNNKTTMTTIKMVFGNNSSQLAGQGEGCDEFTDKQQLWRDLLADNCETWQMRRETWAMVLDETENHSFKQDN